MFNYLAAGNLTHSKELADILGEDWDEEMIRYTYDIAIKRLLMNRKTEIIEKLIGLEGKTMLTLIDDKYYLYENIDIWYHIVHATEEFMSLIVNEMMKQRQMN